MGERKTDQETVPPVKPKRTPKWTPKLRTKLATKKITKSAAKKMVEKRKAGATIWELAEEYWGYPFKHGDRTTWLFYSRVNGLLHKENVPEVKLSIPLDAKLEVNRFVSKFGVQKLITLLRTNRNIRS